MMVLVDTSVWSLALRRTRGQQSPEALELAELIREGRAAIIGPVRQELLSGIKAKQQFELVREHLRAFPNLRLTIDDFELAAEFFNHCRGAGVQGSSTDFLICAVASRRRTSILTTDRDFVAFAKVIPVALHKP